MPPRMVWCSLKALGSQVAEQKNGSPRYILQLQSLKALSCIEGDSACDGCHDNFLPNCLLQ